MALDRIRVWKFDDAPAELKMGFQGSEHPQWLALVPRSVNGPDLDKAIQAHSEIGSWSSYKTDNGDVIHTGSSRMDLFMHALSDVSARTD